MVSGHADGSIIRYMFEDDGSGLTGVNTHTHTHTVPFKTLLDSVSLCSVCTCIFYRDQW